MKNIFTILSLSIFIFFGVFSVSIASEKVDAYLFFGNGCPHCDKEIKFFESIKYKYPDLNLTTYEVYYSQENSLLMQKVANYLGAEGGGVPFLIIGDKYFVGFGDKSSILEIESRINECSVIKCPNNVGGILGLKNEEVVSLVQKESIKNTDGTYLAFTDNGREYSGLEVVSWARIAEELGAGEIVITSVDKEGTGEGYDLELIKSVSEAVSIPVIAHGGASSPDDITRAILLGKADAVTIASILHYSVMQSFGSLSSDYKGEGNISFLNSGKTPKNIIPCSIHEIRSALINAKIPTRY